MDRPLIASRTWRCSQSTCLSSSSAEGVGLLPVAVAESVLAVLVLSGSAVGYGSSSWLDKASRAFARRVSSPPGRAAPFLSWFWAWRTRSAEPSSTCCTSGRSRVGHARDAGSMPRPPAKSAACAGRQAAPNSREYSRDARSGSVAATIPWQSPRAAAALVSAWPSAVSAGPPAQTSARRTVRPFASRSSRNALACSQKMPPPVASTFLTPSVPARADFFFVAAE